MKQYVLIFIAWLWASRSGTGENKKIVSSGSKLHYQLNPSPMLPLQPLSHWINLVVSTEGLCSLPIPLFIYFFALLTPYLKIKFI